jgi:hypothetical protein
LNKGAGIDEAPCYHAIERRNDPGVTLHDLRLGQTGTGQIAVCLGHSGLGAALIHRLIGKSMRLVKIFLPLLGDLLKRQFGLARIQPCLGLRQILMEFGQADNGQDLPRPHMVPDIRADHSKIA